MMPIDRGEFIEAVRLIREDLKGVNDRLDTLNGRTRANEQKIAVLDDRSGSARGAALWGGGVGGVLVAAAEVIRWWSSK